MLEIDLRITNGRDNTPHENYLVVCLFAGHGVLKDGAQALVYNEYNKKTNFYALLNAEKVVRGMANRCSNAYMICIFACCRQLYKSDKMDN